MSFLRRITIMLDRGIDALLWLHERTMLYIALVLLVPMLLLVTFSILVLDLRPFRPTAPDQVATALLGLYPVWILICFVMDRAAGRYGAVWRTAVERAPVVVGLMLFAVGGLMLVAGVE
ncbi:MAG: hypothetical protein ACOYLQ_17865 [Hyphomicrobiaceae bacterium]